MQEAKKCVPHAIIAPSAKRGDILTAVNQGIECIVLIDGYFSWTPSVWHKEILYALKSGVQVIGAASMGALRAAELVDYGMQGYGDVFNYYQHTPIADDADVALFFPAGLPDQATVPLINIRLSLSSTDKGQAERIIRSLDHLHYSQRTWEAIKAALSPTDFALVRSSYRDIKQADAYQCLLALDKIATTSKPFVCPETYFFKMLEDEIFCADEVSGIFQRMRKVIPLPPKVNVPKARIEQLLRFFQTDDVTYLNYWLSLAISLEVKFSEAAIRRNLDRFRIRANLLKGADFKAWCLARSLSLDVIGQTFQDYCLIKRLVMASNQTGEN